MNIGIPSNDNKLLYRETITIQFYDNFLIKCHKIVIILDYILKNFEYFFISLYMYLIQVKNSMGFQLKIFSNTSIQIKSNLFYLDGG